MVGAPGMGNRAAQATEFQADRKRLSGEMANHSGCVADGGKQLKIKYDAWQTLEADAKSGERDRQRRDVIVRECRQEVDKRNTLQGDLDRLQAQLTKDQEALTPPPAQAPLPTRAQQLNFAACDQK